MMFIIEIIYTAPLDVIDAAMKEHMIFLKKYYSKEIFLVSGRKEPRKGGIIIAKGTDKKQIKKIAQEDPFYKKGLAKFKIIEFNASQVSKNIAVLIK